MVSLNTIFTLGVIGAGLLAFTSLGGAGGIGQRLGGSFGGGIRSFNENISSSFNAALQGLNPFAAAQESAASTLSGVTEAVSTLAQSPGSGGSGGGSLETDPSEYGTGSSGVDTTAAPLATPITTTPTPEVISGVVTQGGALGIPAPVPAEGSYLQRITRYVDQPLTTVTPRQASVNVISRAKSDYGGYGSASSQNRELQSLLATNAQKYGSYFN
tara:strand:+ start:224 stop:868 length:645 start_codon:yes stop_codon:yes gene_type:complete